MGVCLLSHVGTLLTFDRRTGELGQVGLRECAADTALLEIDAPPDAFGESFDAFLVGRLPEPHALAPFNGATLVSRDGLRVGLKVGEVFLGVADDGRLFARAPAIDAWESFLPVTRRAIAGLQDVLASDWLVEHDRTVVAAADLRLGTDMTLHVGAARFRLDELMSLDVAPGCASLIFLPGGTLFRRLLRWDPVVYFTAFRSEDVMQQLTLCVSSLIDPGRYGGRIHVVTDRPHAEIVARLAAVGATRVTTAAVMATDFTGWVASKFAILDDPAFRASQPILYVDADIVFDRVVTPMLVDIATALRLSAPTEDYSRLAEARSVGADFLRRAGCTDLGEVRGCNGGTLGIPNIPDHADDLRLMATLIQRYIRAHGRGSLEWVDQEIVNYVGYVRNLFDRELLTRFVRYGDTGDLERPEQRTGLVHFWKLRHGRVPVMRRYLDLVRAEARAAADAGGVPAG